MIAFVCPHCGAPLRVDESKAGRAGSCPACSRVVRTPAPGGASPPDSSAGAVRAAQQPTLRPPAGAEETAPALPASVQLAPPSEYPFLAPPQAEDELGRLGPYRVLKVQAADPEQARRVAVALEIKAGGI